MRILELFSQDHVAATDAIISMIAQARDNGNWERIERVSEIFSRTPYFDWERNKHYLAFTTDEEKLKKELAKANYSDDYFSKRLLKRLRGEQ